MGLTLEDVRNVLLNATVNSPKGSIDGPDSSYTVLDNDQLTEAAPYNDVVVAYRNGAPMHIGDIGQAVRGPQNRELAAWQNGKPGVLLLAFKQPGANVIDTVERIKAALPALEASRSRPRSMSARSSIARRPSAPRSTTWSSRCCCRSAWW